MAVLDNPKKLTLLLPVKPTERHTCIFDHYFHLAAQWNLFFAFTHTNYKLFFEIQKILKETQCVTHANLWNRTGLHKPFGCEWSPKQYLLIWFSRKHKLIKCYLAELVIMNKYLWFVTHNSLTNQSASCQKCSISIVQLWGSKYHKKK